MGQTTILIMILTIVSKIFGFVRESVMAAFIGAGELKSIYTTAMTIPNLLTGIVVSGILSSYIPIYHMVKNDKGEKSAKDFTSNLINILFMYGLAVMIVIIIFARPISKIFSPDLSGESLNLAVGFTRIISFSILAFLSSSVIRGYLNIKGNFIEPVITGFIFNIIIIISTMITGKIGNPYYLIIGTLLAQILQFIRFPFIARKLDFKYKKNLDFNDPYIKKLMFLILPIIASSAADQLSLVVDNSMASAFFGVASVSKIFYAKTMLNFIMGVVTMTVSTVSFPEIARLGQAGEIDKMKNSVSSAIIMTMLLVVPATLGMMSFSTPIISLAFERNAFTATDTLMVSRLLVSYGPFVIFASIMKIFGNAFYSVGDSKTPVIVILIQQIINIILNFILIYFFGIYGLAFATSISTMIGSIIILFLFNKKFSASYRRQNFESIFKICIASILMIMISILTYKYVLGGISQVLRLLLSVFIGGVLYLVIIIMFKIPMIVELFKNIKKGK